MEGKENKMRELFDLWCREKAPDPYELSIILKEEAKSSSEDEKKILKKVVEEESEKLDKKVLDYMKKLEVDSTGGLTLLVDTLQNLNSLGIEYSPSKEVSQAVSQYVKWHLNFDFNSFESRNSWPGSNERSHFKLVKGFNFLKEYLGYFVELTKKGWSDIIEDPDVGFERHYRAGKLLEEMISQKDVIKFQLSGELEKFIEQYSELAREVWDWPEKWGLNLKESLGHLKFISKYSGNELLKQRLQYVVKSVQSKQDWQESPERLNFLKGIYKGLGLKKEAKEINQLRFQIPEKDGGAKSWERKAIKMEGLYEELENRVDNKYNDIGKDYTGDIKIGHLKVDEKNKIAAYIVKKNYWDKVIQDHVFYTNKVCITANGKTKCTPDVYERGATHGWNKENSYQRIKKLLVKDDGVLVKVETGNGKTKSLEIKL